MLLTGKNVLITGGSSGIGQEITTAFAKAGANVVFTYNNHEDGANHTLNCVADYPILKKSIQVDLYKLDKIPSIIQQTEEFLGSIDILINNAAVVTRFPNFMEISSEDLDKVMTVNFKAPFILMQETVKKMKAREIKGNILNISSVSAEITSPGLVHYEASKSALNALTRGSANDLASFGIRVNAISPGLVETNMNKNQREKDPGIWNFRKSKIPLKRAGNPIDIANMAIFLCSEQAEWITGVIVPVDGGLSVFSPFSI
jgi:glucose 1-dehydrogenase